MSSTLESQKLSRLSQDPMFVQKYIGKSSFGANKIVYLPLLIGIAVSLSLIYLLFGGYYKQIGLLSIIIMAVITIVCFIIVKMITDASKKMYLAKYPKLPLGLGKIVLGNDAAGQYYYIYAYYPETSEDELNKLRNKILNTCDHATTADEKNIQRLFQAKLSAPHEFGKPLPVGFTDGKEIWRKEISFQLLPKTIANHIKLAEGIFPLVMVAKDNPKVLLEYYEG